MVVSITNLTPASPDQARIMEAAAVINSAGIGRLAILGGEPHSQSLAAELVGENIIACDTAAEVLVVGTRGGRDMAAILPTVLEGDVVRSTPGSDESMVTAITKSDGRTIKSIRLDRAGAILAIVTGYRI